MAEPREVTEAELAEKAVAPRVTPADIDGQIVAVTYLNGYEAAILAGHVYGKDPDTGEMVRENSAPEALKGLTLCLVTLKCGFTVIGMSASVYDANFNPQIGRDLSYKHAYSQIWPLEGYILANVRHGRKVVIETAEEALAKHLAAQAAHRETPTVGLSYAEALALAKKRNGDKPAEDIRLVDGKVKLSALDDVHARLVEQQAEIASEVRKITGIDDVVQDQLMNGTRDAMMRLGAQRVADILDNAVCRAAMREAAT